jgi:DNA-binding PadR family transcriptional regulator
MSREINKKLVKGMLGPLILRIVNDHPCHGYFIKSKINKMNNVCFGASTIYPELKRLSNKGYIKPVWDMNGKWPRKVYAITLQGEKMLHEDTCELQIIVKQFLQIEVQN